LNVRIVGVDSQGGAEVEFGLREMVLQGQSLSEIAVRLGVGRVDPERSFKMGDGFAKLVCSARMQPRLL